MKNKATPAFLLACLWLLLAAACGKQGGPNNPEPPDPELPLPEQIQSDKLLWRTLLNAPSYPFSFGRGAVLRNGNIEIATSSGAVRVDVQNGAQLDQTSFGAIRGGLANIHTHDRFIVNHEYRLTTLSGEGAGDNTVRVFDMSTLLWFETYPHVPFSDTVFDRMAGVGKHVYFLQETQSGAPALVELDFTTDDLTQISGGLDSLTLLNVPDAWDAGGNRYVCLIAKKTDGSMVYAVYDRTQQQVVGLTDSDESIPYLLWLDYGGQADGKIFIRCRGAGIIQGLNIADGSIIWQHGLAGSNITLLGAQGNRLFLLENNTLLVLDTDTGNPVWSAPLEGTFIGHAFMDGRIVVQTLSHLYCFSSENGQTTLNVSGFGLYKTGYPVIVKAEQGLIFIGWEKYLLCFEG